MCARLSRTIGILGQVLRNGASSIEGSEKLAIMEETLGLARRVLGRIYSFQGEIKTVDEVYSSARVSHSYRHRHPVQNRRGTTAYPSYGAGELREFRD